MDTIRSKWRVLNNNNNNNSGNSNSGGGNANVGAGTLPRSTRSSSSTTGSSSGSSGDGLSPLASGGHSNSNSFEPEHAGGEPPSPSSETRSSPAGSFNSAEEDASGQQKSWLSKMARSKKGTVGSHSTSTSTSTSGLSPSGKGAFFGSSNNNSNSSALSSPTLGSLSSLPLSSSPSTASMYGSSSSSSGGGSGGSAASAAGGGGGGGSAYGSSHGPAPPPPVTHIEDMASMVFASDSLFALPDSAETIVFSDGETNKDTGIPVIRGGTLTKLVERLTFDKYVDTNYLQQFLLTYRTFTSPRELLALLVERYEMSDPIRATEQQLNAYKTIRKVVRLRVFNIVKTWTDKHFYDFARDPKLQEELEAFIEQLAQTGMTNPAEFLRDFLARKRAEQLLEDNALAAKKTSSSSSSSSSATGAAAVLTSATGGKSTSLLKVHPLELAKQMTQFEFDLYRKITPPEVNNQNWNKGTREQKLQRSPNVIALIERFNEVSNWVATMLVSEGDLETRRDLLVFFIHLANHCRELNNFNGMMAVVSGVTATSTFRLKKTWALLDRNTATMISELQTLLSRDNNFKNYRAALRLVQPPLLPYLGVYLTDLTFIDQGNSDLLPGTQLINFYKRRLSSHVIREIQQYQQQAYAFPPNEAISEALKSLDFQSEDDCYTLSLKIEPREETTLLKNPVPEKALPPGADPPDTLQFDYEPDYPFKDADSADNVSFMDFDELRNRYSIRAGTIEKLIERLTYHKYPDSDFMTAFLVTYRAFLAPRRLFELLMYRFNTPLPIKCLNEELRMFKKDRLTPIRLRVINVIKNWLDKHFFDFAEDKVLTEAFLGFVQADTTVEPPIDVAVEQLRNLFKRKLKELGDADGATSSSEEQPAAGASAEAPKAPPSSSLSTGSTSIFTQQPAEFSQQLAMINKRSYGNIDTIKILISNVEHHASRPQPTETPTPIPTASGKGEIRSALFSPEVIEFQLHVDALGIWVANTIVSCADIRERVDAIIRFVELAETSRQLCDFSTMFAVVYGLSSPPVKALRRLWSTFPSKPHLNLLNDMQKLTLIREGGDHSVAYQQQLKRAAIMPTVLYVKSHLEKLQELCSEPDYVTEFSLINFDKHRRIAQVLQDISLHQKKASFDFTEIPAVKAFVEQLSTSRTTFEHLLPVAVQANEADELVKYATVRKQGHYNVAYATQSQNVFLSSPQTPSPSPPNIKDREAVGGGHVRSASSASRVSQLSTDTTGSSINNAVSQLMSDPAFRQEVREAAVEAIVGGIFKSPIVTGGRVGSMEEHVVSLREEVSDQASLLLVQWSVLSPEKSVAFVLAFLRERFPDADVRLWSSPDPEGYVYGWPENAVTLAVITADGRQLVVDVKPLLSESDVSVLVRKARFYNEILVAIANAKGLGSVTCADCAVLVPPMAVSAAVRDVATRLGVVLISTGPDPPGTDSSSEASVRT